MQREDNMDKEQQKQYELAMQEYLKNGGTVKELDPKPEKTNLQKATDKNRRYLNSLPHN
jgi:hypothetical protein